MQNQKLLKSTPKFSALALLAALTTATFSYGSIVQACPPKPGTEQLTFSRIMMNLGRMTLKADSLVREMNQNGQSKEDPALAAQDLAVAISCSQIAAAAAAAPDVTLPEVAILLPQSIDKCTAENKPKYLEQLHKMMVRFTEFLEQYKTQISTADFAGAGTTAAHIKDLADLAHEKLNPSTFCENTLASKPR